MKEREYNNHPSNMVAQEVCNNSGALHHYHVECVAGIWQVSVVMETCNSDTIAKEGRSGRDITGKLRACCQLLIPI